MGPLKSPNTNVTRWNFLLNVLEDPLRFQISFSSFKGLSLRETTLRYVIHSTLGEPGGLSSGSEGRHPKSPMFLVYVYLYFATNDGKDTHDFDKHRLGSRIIQKTFEGTLTPSR